MSRLSIVIPCLGGAADFDATLVSVLQNRPADCEIIVAHTQPYDDPYNLRGEVRFLHIECDSTVELLNAALITARSEVLHIIGCGLEATDGWTGPALAHFDDPDVAAVSPVICEADAASVVAAGVRWSLGGSRRVVNDHRVLSPGSGRLRARIQGPTLSAAFFRRDVLAALGGFDPAFGDGLADVAIGLDVKTLGKLHVCEPSSRLSQTNCHPSLPAGGFAGGLAAEKLFWHFARRRGLALSLTAHPLAVIADLIQQAPLAAIASLFGRAAALIQVGGAKRYEQRIQAAIDRLEELQQLKTKLRVKSIRPAPASGVARRKAA